MRFKREDLGLYFATALIGGGIGLLTGAFITSRINKKREEDEENEPMEWPEDDEGWPVGDDEPIMSIDSSDLARGSTFPTSKDLSEPIGKVVEVTADEKGLKTIVEFPPKRRLSKDDRMHLQRLNEEYVITPMQAGLIESGVMDVEELEAALIEAEFDQTPEEELEPVDYGRQYRLDEKPDMSSLLEKPADDTGPRHIEDLLVVVDERWEILLEPPVGKDERQKRVIYFDPNDETVFTRSGDNEVVPADLRVITSPAVREIIMPWLLFEEDMEAIYIDDIQNKRSRWYEIVRLGDDEDVSEHDPD